MDYINLYNGSVSNNNTTGTMVTGDNRIITTVKTTGEEQVQTIGIRCETGYSTDGETVLELIGDTKDAWCFEYNGVKGAYGEPLTITDTISNKNVIFKLYSKVLEGEKPCIKQDVNINLKATIKMT